MSRLDINIRRLKAQRACLDRAAELIRDLPGVVFELGLGNGRTYDHLREIFPGREIFVFEREVAAHPDCIPDEDHLFRGDFSDTLPVAVERFPGAVAFVHADVGSANAARDARLAHFIASQLPTLLLPGGLVASDRDVGFTGGLPLDLPAELDANAYFMFRLDPAAAPATAGDEIGRAAG